MKIKDISCETNLAKRGGTEFVCSLHFWNLENQEIEIIHIEEPHVVGIVKQETKATKYDEMTNTLSSDFYNTIWQNKNYTSGKIIEIFKTIDTAVDKSRNTKWLEKLSNLKKIFKNKYLEQLEKIEANYKIKNSKEAEDTFALNEEYFSETNKKKIQNEIEKLKKLEEEIKYSQTTNINERIGVLEEFFKRYSFVAKRHLYKSITYQLDFKLYYKKLGDAHQEKRLLVKQATTSITIAPSNLTMVTFTMLGSIVGSIISFISSVYNKKLDFIEKCQEKKETIENCQRKLELENLEIIPEKIDFWYIVFKLTSDDFISDDILNFFGAVGISCLYTVIFYFIFATFKKGNQEVFRYNVVYAFFLGITVALLQEKIFSYLLFYIEKITQITT